MLCRKHLLGQHKEIHQIIDAVQGTGSVGWRHHPEVSRWMGDPTWPIAIHELTRLEMNARWPGRHDDEHHPTPVDWPLGSHPEANAALWAWDEPDAYLAILAEGGYPLTRLPDKTPWDRDGLTRDEYLAMRETYVRQSS